MNYARMVSIGKSAVSFCIGLGLTTPAIVEVLYFGRDNESIKLKSDEKGRKFSNPELQDYVDKQCLILQIQKVVLVDAPGMQDMMTMRLPGQRSIFLCTLDPKAFTTEEAKGVLNHELGHCFHEHHLQRTAIESLIGMMFFFRKTRILAVSCLAVATLFENSWHRFLEKQADDLAIQISNKSEIEGMINAMQRVRDTYPNSCHNNADHPPVEERIGKFQEALKKYG